MTILEPLMVGESDTPLAYLPSDGEPFPLNVGCGPHYADGWVNTDLVATEQIQPDLTVTPDRPFPFRRTVNRVYLGHVLEHVPWQQVPDWLDQLRACLIPGAPVMVVGPDTVRTLERWKAGDEDWGKVQGVLEGTGAYFADLEGFEPIRWDADRHHWNCHEARVVEVLEACGFEQVEALAVEADGRLPEARIREAGWPLVAGEPCQFAVQAVAP